MECVGPFMLLACRHKGTRKGLKLWQEGIQFTDGVLATANRAGHAHWRDFLAGAQRAAAVGSGPGNRW